jgi:uncharacterized iron-regulated protein
MLALALFLQTIDPYLLPIGTPGKVTAQPSVLVCTQTGRKVGMEDLLRTTQGVRYLLVGESHTNADHHRFQARVINALVDTGRPVIVGLEMFTRPNQVNLAPMSLGKWDDKTFQEQADWKNQWGFDYALYKPIFDVIRERRLPMVALNVPRDWVRSVGRGGLAALSEEQRSQLPEIYLGNASHRSVFDALMGGHPPSGAQGENIYAAQVLWDEAMADSAIKAMRWRGRQSIMVVVAGSGHVMYDQGIGYRITRQSGEPSVSVVCIEGDKPREVSRGIARFVYMSPAAKE